MMAMAVAIATNQRFTQEKRPALRGVFLRLFSFEKGPNTAKLGAIHQQRGGCDSREKQERGVIAALQQLPVSSRPSAVPLSECAKGRRCPWRIFCLSFAACTFAAQPQADAAKKTGIRHEHDHL